MQISFKDEAYYAEKNIIKMTQVKPWLKAFNISLAHFQEWEKQTPKEESTTMWALKNKKIDTQEYLKWASNHYGIPILDPAFIHNISISFEFWNEVKDKATWNEAFLPVFKWEESIFSACIEKSSHHNTAIQPLLLAPDALKTCWQKIQSFNTKITSPSLIASDSDSTSDSISASVSDLTRDSHQKPAQDLENESGDKDTTTQVTLLTKIKNIFHKTNLYKENDTRNKSSDLYLEVIEKSTPLYTSAIIFSYQNKQFTPIKWSSHFTNKKSEKIDTHQPSIFRIVRKSLRPYHGFVVPNTIHRDFFSHWGFSNMPAHVTLLPIFSSYSNKKLIGAFMGIADVSIHPAKLTRAMTWCKPLSKPLSKLFKKAS